MIRPRLSTPGSLRGAATRAQAATALGVASCLVLAGVSAAAAADSGSGETHLKIHFVRAVGLYSGSSVRVLGVGVGKIGKIHPEGTSVAVDVTVKDGVRVPLGVTAVVVPPSLVSDRYIQLSAFRPGDTTAPDGYDVTMDHTRVPVEKDQVLASLDKLDHALGPDGANSGGSLSRLVHTGAANLAGNGTQLNQTLRDLTDLVTSLDANGDDLNGTVKQLDTFTQVLLRNDGGIRRLYTDLASVSAQLDDDRAALAAAFSNLAVATKQLGDLAKGSRGNLKADIEGLVDISNVLVQNRKALEETLDTAPLGLANLSGAYSPVTQTLDVRSNLPVSDGSGLSLLLCTALQSSPVPAQLAGPACDAAKSLPPPPSGGGGAPPPAPGPPAVPPLPPPPPLPSLPGLPSLGAAAGGGHA